jgi:uncharacterized protein YjbI with pentapeptide repeats
MTSIKDISIEEFIQRLQNGEKSFRGIAVEDYSFSLSGFQLDGIEFVDSFINILFLNCSFKGSKFIRCNLKCISFTDCDLSNCEISECAVESLEIVDCKTDGIVFGTNYAYGLLIQPGDDGGMIK